MSAFSQSEESAIANLVDILNMNDALQADVEQLTIDQGGAELQQFKARLIMQKPDHFYWELIEPYQELMVTNGDKIWIYEADLDQVTIQAFDPDPSRTPILLLNGDAESLGQAYGVSQSELPDGLGSRFLLRPKDPASLLLNLSLTFQDNILQELQYENSIGAQTSLSFSNQDFDSEIDSAIFNFEPPQGIEIIDTTQN